MEPIPAAQAMQWSIELDKGLRSKKPGLAVEAILRMGPRLVQWSHQPNITASTANMFGLVLGEDRAFANTIILRLTDAFESGDKSIRACILKILLLEMRSRRRPASRYDGILSKQRVPNYMEVLRRIKVVFDKGDVESRALALRVIGCLADFAKDSAEIRFTIVSTLLESQHDMELKASLFCAGCLCELSEGFACVVLEAVISLLASKRASYAVKKEAAHIFSKMGSSYPIVCKAYEYGRKLIVNPINADIVDEMLVSLSRLASRSSVLVSDQVNLLLSFINHDQLSNSHLTALRCFGLLTSKAISCIPIRENVVRVFLVQIENGNVTLSVQYEAMKNLHKFCCYFLPHLDGSTVVDIIKVIGNAAYSQSLQLQYMAFHVLVDIACCLKKMGQGNWCDPCEECTFLPELHEGNMQHALVTTENYRQTFPLHLVLLIMDQISLIYENLVSECKSGEVANISVTTTDSLSMLVQQCKNLLGFIVVLAREYPMVSTRALGKVKGLVETLASIQAKLNSKCIGNAEGGGEDCNFQENCGSSHCHPLRIGQTLVPLTRVLLASLCRFSFACLNFLDAVDAVDAQVCKTITLLAEHVWQSEVFSDGVGMCMIFSLLLHSHLMNNQLEGRKLIQRCTSNLGTPFNGDVCMKETDDVDNMKSNHDSFWINHEYWTLKLAKRTVISKKFWLGYKIGKYAGIQGAWFTSSYIFNQLLNLGIVQSVSCHCWLRSVSYFANAENAIQSLFYGEENMQILGRILVNKDDGQFSRNLAVEAQKFYSKVPNLQEYGTKVAQVHREVRLAEEILASAATSKFTFYFQRWFLNLRVRVLEAVADMLELLSVLAHSKNSQDGECIGVSFGLAQNMDHMVHQFTHMSFQLYALSKEFDLLVTSFMGIDSKSARYISVLSLGCSLLAFSAAFVVCFPKLPAYQVGLVSLLNSKKWSHVMLVQNLAARLWHADKETSKELQLFMRALGDVPFLPSRTQVPSTGYEERHSLKICRFAVLRVLRLQNAVDGVKDSVDKNSIIKAGLEHLSEVISRWICIRFRIPGFFFRARPCCGAEIYSGPGSNEHGGISIFQGSWLSLNVCIQVKNVPPEQRARLAKFYCIIAAQPSESLPDGENHRQVGVGFRAWKTEEMMMLNEELMVYMRREASERIAKADDEGFGGSGLVKSFARMRPNEYMQGFATCMLDVSLFPVGTYQCVWHSCCVDNNGYCWSLLPLNSGPIFTIKRR